MSCATKRAALLVDGVYLQEIEDALSCLRSDEAVPAGCRTKNHAEQRKMGRTLIDMNALVNILESYFDIPSFCIKYAAIPHVESEHVDRGTDASSMLGDVHHPVLVHCERHMKSLRRSGFVVQSVPMRRSTWPHCADLKCPFSMQPIRVLCPEGACVNHRRDCPLDVYYRDGLDAHLVTKLLQLGLRSQNIDIFVLLLREGEYEPALQALTMEEKKTVHFATLTAAGNGWALRPLAEHLRPYASPHPSRRREPGICELMAYVAEIGVHAAVSKEHNTSGNYQAHTAMDTKGIAGNKPGVAWQQITDDLILQYSDALFQQTAKPVETKQEEKKEERASATRETDYPPTTPLPTNPNGMHLTNKAHPLLEANLSTRPPEDATTVDIETIKEEECAHKNNTNLCSVPLCGNGNSTMQGNDVVNGCPSGKKSELAPTTSAVPPFDDFTKTQHEGAQNQQQLPTSVQSSPPPVPANTTLRRVQTNLPVGYSMHFHSASKRYYYLHEAERTTSWMHPYGAAAQADVERQVAESLAMLALMGQGISNNKSNTSQTTNVVGAQHHVSKEGEPATVVPASCEWIEVTDPSTKAVYYYNATTRETSWVKP